MRKLILLFAVILFFANQKTFSVEPQDVVSINFRGSEVALEEADEAGLIPAKYWYNTYFANRQTTEVYLKNGKGELFGATGANDFKFVGHWSASDAKGFATAPEGANKKMMNGVCHRTDGGAVSTNSMAIGINYIPESWCVAGYDVYLYWSSYIASEASTEKLGRYAIQKYDKSQKLTGDKYISQNYSTFDGTFVESMATDSATARANKTANYIKFENLKEPDILIDVFNPTRGGRAGLSGIQLVKRTSTGIKNAYTSPLKVYYSSESKQITIFSDAELINPTIEIIAATGQIVKRIDFANSAEKSISISDLSKGIYIINAASNGKTKTQKLIIK